MTTRIAVLLVLVLVFLPGCALLEAPTPAPQTGPFPYHSLAEAPAPLRRVVMLPLDAESCPAPHRLLVERSLQRAIAARNLFEILPVDERDVADTHIVSTRSTGTYHTDDLILLSRRFGAEGVLHGVITQFQAYPQVVIGLRLTLLDCRNGRVPWATDILLDASNRVIEQDVHNYYDTRLRDQGSLMDYEQVLISPRYFADYGADRVSGTLAKALLPRNEIEASNTRR
ncbi:MAG: hypothetical protein H6807_13860 [Planctomycetes bacterium]|nr:hypothetical protein [Planctomycetota bacterium]